MANRGSILCPHCDGDIGECVAKCRHCGEWVKPRLWRRRLLAATAVVAVMLLIPIFAVGAISPCGIVKAQIMKQARTAIGEDADGFGALGVALGAAAVDQVVATLSPMECVGALASGKFSGRAMQSSQHDAYKATMKTDLRILPSYQEMHLETYGTYSGNVQDLGLATPVGVSVRIITSSASGWAAEATHSKLAGQSCVVYDGVIDKVPATAGTGKEPRAPLLPRCD